MTTRYNTDIEAVRRHLSTKYKTTRFDVIAFLSGYDPKITINMARKIAMELFINGEIEE